MRWAKATCEYTPWQLQRSTNCVNQLGLGAARSSEVQTDVCVRACVPVDVLISSAHDLQAVIAYHVNYCYLSVLLRWSPTRASSTPWCRVVTPHVRRTANDGTGTLRRSRVLHMEAVRARRRSAHSRVPHALHLFLRVSSHTDRDSMSTTTRLMHPRWWDRRWSSAPAPAQRAPLHPSVGQRRSLHLGPNSLRSGA